MQTCLLLQLVLSVVDGEGVVILAEPVDERLQARKTADSSKRPEEQEEHTVAERIDLTWMEGFCKWPRFEVVWRGSVESCIWWPMRRKASMTTFPLTLWIGSITTATARADRASKLCKETREGGGKEVEEKRICR